MGCFTWTLANRTPKKVRGRYAAQCILRYDSYGAIVCPDDTIISEPHYEGYGVFDGKDVYDLVVDWNKDYLTEIPKLPGLKSWHDKQEMLASKTPHTRRELRTTMVSRKISICFRFLNGSRGTSMPAATGSKITINIMLSFIFPLLSYKIPAEN